MTCLLNLKFLEEVTEDKDAFHFEVRMYIDFDRHLFWATSKATTTFQLHEAPDFKNFIRDPPSSGGGNYINHRDKQAIILSTINYLVCLASVSVWFRSKERPRNGIFSFNRAKNGTRASPIFCAVLDSPSSFFYLLRNYTTPTRKRLPRKRKAGYWGNSPLQILCPVTIKVYCPLSIKSQIWL